MKPTLHLVCNAHLDPVWLWDWEEGAAAVLSTFRTAADLCEEFPGFIFNHNEVILYKWVEEYEPELFSRIQRLVKEKKWHIMGGWYLQPDCNMPSGESFVRQILIGRRYFEEKFGVRPTTAINFDPFGHTRGLVQIMVKSGYDSYIVCRPGREDIQTPGDEFIWEGYDGSRLTVLRVPDGYNSPLGKAREKIEKVISQGITSDTLILWGVGNHGGGPSRKDLRDLAQLRTEQSDADISHSTPEKYFNAIRERSAKLPVHSRDLNPWAVGCYTSMVRIKQKHRLLENEFYAAEKMCTAVFAQGRMAYPKTELDAALSDLATAEFHDILPGSSVETAEDMALRLLGHGLENVSRVKTRAFFALAKGQPAAREGDIPVLVYNPHPFAVKTIVECEFNLQDFNWDGPFTDMQVFSADAQLPTQVEKEVSNLNLDWRKRVAFSAILAPSQMNRFDCRARPMPLNREFRSITEDFIFKTADLEVRINARTGLLDIYRIKGVDYVRADSCSLLVLHDNPDPWGMREKSYRNLLGAFSLLPPAENQRFSGVCNPSLASVRIIEDGEVRTVVEAVLGYCDSRAVVRYKIPRQGSEIEIELRVLWNGKDRMLKMSIPTPDVSASYLGQVAYGVEELPCNGNEAAAQKWTAVVSDSSKSALTIINDGIYGSDFCNGEARLSLLRSPAYSAHPLKNRPILPDDRYSPRIDQGERFYRFWLNGGTGTERLAVVDRESLVHNEKPMALSFFPVGDGRIVQEFLTLSDDVIQLSALKKTEVNDDILVRLFNPTDTERRTHVRLLTLNKEVRLLPFEIRSFRVVRSNDGWIEVNLVEEKL